MDTCIVDSCVIDTCIKGIKNKEEDKEVNFAWVTRLTRPERPKGAKDEVKEARRAID